MDAKEPEAETRLPVRYIFWPSQSLRCSLFAVQYQTELLVESAWVDDVRSALAPDLQEDIFVLNELGVFNEVMDEQFAHAKTMLTMSEFIVWIRELPLECSVWDMSRSSHIPALDPNGAWYQALDPGQDPRHRIPRHPMTRIRHLCSSPAEVKDLTVTTS